jgi:uncharacterized protein
MRCVGLIGAVLLLTAPAVAEPSFDCARAASAIEKTICDSIGFGLAEKDAMLARLYRGLKDAPGQEALPQSQKDWMAARDRRNTDEKCLSEVYETRIVELARLGGDAGRVSGRYSYNLGEDVSFGSGFFAVDSAGNLSAHLSTASTPAVHTCEVDAREALSATDNVWIFVDKPSETSPDDPQCRILFRRNGNAIEVNSTYCSQWCGARGNFDAVYTK